MVRLITLSAHIWHGFTADFPEGRALKEIIITKNEENQRLDKFLLKYMNKASKGFIYKMLRKKRIKYRSPTNNTGPSLLNLILTFITYTSAITHSTTAGTILTEDS